MQAVLLNEVFTRSKGLRFVVFIPSNDSDKHREEFKAYLECMGLWKDGIIKLDNSVDYENIEALQKAIRSRVKELKKEGISERDMILDITAGQKTFSVVSAAITFKGETKICYVNKERRVRIFDIRIKDDREG